MYWLEHRRAAWMNIAACRHPKASLKRGGKIRDDVAEHIVGDDHIKLPRVADHLHAKRIHVHMLRPDVRILSTDFFEYTLPQPPGVSHSIRLVTHQHFATRGTVELFILLTIV